MTTFKCLCVSILALSAVSGSSIYPRHVKNSNTSAHSSGLSSYSYIYDFNYHHINKWGLMIDNIGGFGLGSEGIAPDRAFEYRIDFGGEYPKGTNLQYALSTAPWVGGIINETDTLVSINGSFWTDEWMLEFLPATPFEQLIHRSTLDSNSEGAISEEDWISTVIDTVTITTDPIVGYDWQTRRPHRPLGLQIRQETCAWSYGYAEDFILANLKITNIGNKNIQQAFLPLSPIQKLGFQEVVTQKMRFVGSYQNL